MSWRRLVECSYCNHMKNTLLIAWRWWGSWYSIFSFMCMFYRSLFVLLYFFFWLLCCLSFFDIGILITPVVSYRFWLPLWYLTDSDYRFGILQILITPVVSSNSSWKLQWRNKITWIIIYLYCQCNLCITGPAWQNPLLIYPWFVKISSSIATSTKTAKYTAIISNKE